jgi:hypothetical protein
MDLYLPAEILSIIFGRLKIREKIILRTVCSYWKSVIDEYTIWKVLNREGEEIVDYNNFRCNHKSVISWLYKFNRTESEELLKDVLSRACEDGNLPIISYILCRKRKIHGIKRGKVKKFIQELSIYHDNAITLDFITKFSFSVYFPSHYIIDYTIDNSSSNVMEYMILHFSNDVRRYLIRRLPVMISDNKCDLVEIVITRYNLDNTNIYKFNDLFISICKKGQINMVNLLLNNDKIHNYIISNQSILLNLYETADYDILLLIIEHYKLSENEVLISSKRNRQMMMSNNKYAKKTVNYLYQANKKI